MKTSEKALMFLIGVLLGLIVVAVMPGCSPAAVQQAEAAPAAPEPRPRIVVETVSYLGAFAAPVVYVVCDTELKTRLYVVSSGHGVAVMPAGVCE